MRALRTILFVQLACGLIAAGVLPPKHLHRETEAYPHLVHSHFLTSPGHSPPHGPSLLTSGDDDHVAVPLDGLTISRAPAPPSWMPGRVPHAAWVPPPAVFCGTVAPTEPLAAESPPVRSPSSRAPPAC